MSLPTQHDATLGVSLGSVTDVQFWQILASQYASIREKEEGLLHTVQYTA